MLQCEAEQGNGDHHHHNGNYSAQEQKLTLPKIMYDYEFLDTVGEGGSATVKAARNIKTNRLIAVKILRKEGGESTPGMTGSKQQAIKKSQWDGLRKEIMIHSSMKHRNIIELFEAAEDNNNFYILMELAIAGELFDRIEPDFGVPVDLAHYYYKQLVLGMQYMHSNGVAHRDLKPENLLLHQDGNLRISDFGLATVFRYKGKTRKLTTPCGTPPYVAPEIHEMHYDGDSVDIWSSGIILYVLFTGSTPWGEPTKNDPDFVYYSRAYPNKLNYEPWNQFQSEVKTLILGILNIDTTKRYTISDILKSKWLSQYNPLLSDDGRCVDPRILAERMQKTMEYASQQTLSQQNTHYPSQDPNSKVLACTQINPISKEEVDSYSQTQIHNNDIVSYSQPNDMRADMNINIDNYSHEMLSLSQQPQNNSAIAIAVAKHDAKHNAYQNSFSQQVTSNGYQGLSPYNRNSDLITGTSHLTRAFVNGTMQEILNSLLQTFDCVLVPYKLISKGPTFTKVMFTTVDMRKCQLHGQVTIQTVNQHKEMGDNTLMVRFLKSKGDPLEFKRFYRTVWTSLLNNLAA